MRSYGEMLGQLTGIIGELAASDPTADSITGLRKVIERAEAEFCRQVRVFDAGKGYAAPDQGTETMPAWLRHYCRMAPGDASRHVRVARMLPSLPETEAAFTVGDISYQHAAQVVELARTTSITDAQAAEVTLLPLASCTVTLIEGAIAAPAAAFVGCAVNASFAAAPGAMLNAALVDGVSAPELAVMV